MEHSWKNVPKLGFGLMRLPMLEGEVDIEQFKKMVDAFLAAGFTYFDTAYGYINGKSEAAAKVALVERYPRDSFTLATKLPAWAGPKTAEEAKQMFWTSLERTGAGYFDFYLLHNIGAPRIKSFDDFGIWDFLKERKAEGLIKHLGFSFHDSPEMLDRVLTEHPDMDFIQLQINYADWEDPGIQSRGCWEVARKHNKAVVIMEPVKGGTLANLAPDVRKPFEEAGLDPVLSGMSTLEQMEQNIAFLKDPSPLSEKEKTVIDEARRILQSRPMVPCTNCRYCAPGCPMSISIPDIFQARNKDLVYGDRDGALGFYKMVSAGAPASQCVGCGQCEAACPQHIGIIDALKEIAADYDK